MPRSPAPQLPAGRLCRTCVKPCSSSRPPDLRCVVVVRKEVFDAGKARAPRGREPVEESDLVEEHRQVGGEFRHGYALGLTPSTNTRPSRSARVLTSLKPSASSDGTGLKRRRGRGSAAEQRAESAARRAADDDGAAAGPQDAEQLAHGGHAVLGAHRAEQSAGVVDDDQVECFLVRGQPGRRRHLDLDEHAGILDRLARPRRRGIVGNERDGASGDADLRGNGGEAAAVRAADLRDAIAHPHAGHADDQQVRFVAPAPQGNHRQR